MSSESEKPSEAPQQLAAAKWKTTRRNLALASGLMAIGLVTQVKQAFAMALPLRGGGGKGGGAHCFLAGTLIQGPAGEVPIESLKAGDLVIVQSGEAKPVLRLLAFPISADHARGSRAARPVKIERDALEPGVPSRDLYVSQGHMLHIDGVLIAAGNLVNGNTIRIVEPAARAGLDYYHVELAGHEVVLAENTPCETYAETEAAYAGPVVMAGGVRSHVASRLRSAASPFIDIRNHGDIVRDRLEERAIQKRAA